MSIYYRDKNGSRRVVAGMTPGGDLAMGANTTRSGSYTVPALAAGGTTAITVTFNEPMPDDDFCVTLDTGTTGTLNVFNVRSKTANGFIVNVTNNSASASQSSFTAYYKAYKLYTVSEAEQNASDITTIKSYIPTTTTSSNKLVNADEVGTLLDTKQDTLTFDSTPTADSNNPVTSDGIKDAIDDVEGYVDDTATDIYEVMGKNGAKNLLEYPYPNSTGTIGGVSFVDNGDGSVTVNGTASSGVGFRLALYTSHELEVGRYILSVPQVNNTINIAVNVLSDGTSERTIDQCGKTKASFEFDLDYSDYDYVKILIWVPAGTTVDNIIIKPMLRLASDTDPTYQPYAMTNQQMTPYVQSVSNPNLLDNPWFTINQRGITDSWNTQFSVGVDRWAKSSDSSSTLEVTTDGIAEVDGKAFSIYQVLDNTATNYESIKRLYGKTLMLSVLFSDGTIETGSYNLPLSDYRPSTNQIRTFINNSTRIEYARIESFAVGNVNLAIRVKAGNVIRAVKLELGTVSTLANDTAPNYQQELAKCQKYFVRLKTDVNSASPIGRGFAVNVDDMWFDVALPVCMRTRPSITYSDLSDFTYSSTNFSGGVVPSAITVGSMFANHLNVLVRDTVNALTIGPTYIIYASSSNAYLDFTADL